MQGILQPVSRLFGLGGVSLVLAATACGASSVHRQAQTPSSRTGCPQHVLYRASALASIHGVLNAAQRVLARQTTMSQGTTYHLTPRNAPIDYLQQLGTDRTLPGATLRRVAAKLCGEQVAQASWAVHYDLPVAVVAGLAGYPFFVKTRSGWQFWGWWCGAGRSSAWGRQNCV